jgi:thiol-disulfide isomerase/thioredoxin
MSLVLMNIILFTCTIISTAQEFSTGQWQGKIRYEQTDVPFTFEVARDELDNYSITLINGAESITITNTHWEGDSLIIPMHSFDAEIIAKVSKESMSGRWVKNYKNNPGLPFTASFGKARFPKSSKKKTKVKLPESLKLTIAPKGGLQYQAISLFQREGNEISGTILTEVGDYRYFEGIIDGDSLKASSFDGAHAFMLLGRYSDKFWSGELILDNGYSEPWVASIDPAFTLADPFIEIDHPDPKIQEPYFDILTAGSEFNSLDKADFIGRVTIIQLLGSWCPNSLDQTQYLTQWYEANNQRHIEILAVFFEMNYSKEYGMQRINDYVALNNIAYPTALGGPANKGQAALAFPFINKLEAFPTLMILDKAGRVRYMHSYFLGPATGNYYREFDARFNTIVDQLLKE